MKTVNTTLLFLRDGNRILLATKKRGFGEGKWNGVGGKVEPGESVEHAMVRESQEEVCVTPTNYEKMAEIEFFEYVEDTLEKVFMNVFVSSKWEGTPVESEEMAPNWFNIEDIPYDKMFGDDKFWLPVVLTNQKIKASFTFDKNWKIINKSIKKVERL